MTATRKRAELVSRLRRPQTTVRWRLTLLYGALFLGCGAALLAVTYALVVNANSSRQTLSEVVPSGVELEVAVLPPSSAAVGSV